MFRQTKGATTPTGEEKRLATRDPWDPAAVFDEMDRWFEDLRRDIESRFGSPFRGWGTGNGTDVRKPLVDLRDAGNEFVMTADLPGVSKENLEITVTPEMLQVHAKTGHEREEKRRDYHVAERTYSELYRAIPLPVEVVPETAAATLENGVLEVRLPKKEPMPAVKPVKVPVK